ncbi:methyl-accepting chemotaxis protein [Tissierella creatinophila]|uniref:histidine kinase n=1 Tax=Tissierella creatinophila DSM 6911 TaxID=1123403 RepID=A0A1U7M5A4_TISCR|nr:methyl-accepting chemotaxis protein [Tissierella creatinophila]OLS02504.1 methyl-accepting chemotaxis protein PctB [Tissierella creatinophila DSM 6911]
MKLKTKNVLMILLPVSLISSLIVSMIIYDVYQSQKRNSTLLIQAIAKDYANSMKLELEKPLFSVRGIADVLEDLVSEGAADRDVINAVLANTLKDNDNLFAAWACFEPNAFDGKDEQYVGKKGHDSTGRFVPYWHRDGEGLDFEALKGYTVEGEGDYYLQAFKSGEETVVEPYYYDAGESQVLMSTIAVPIIINGKTVGVVGVDILFDRLQEVGDGIKLYKTGYGRLISSEGLVVTHPDKSTIGEPAGEFVTGDAEKVFKKIKQKEVFTENVYSKVHNKKVLKSFAPISIGDTGTIWSFSTVVPQEEVFAELYSIMLRIAIISIIGLGIIAAVIYKVSSDIVNPITYITDRLKEIANYDFTYSEKENKSNLFSRKDEIGQISNATLTMKNNIVHLIREINENTENVAATSEELTAICQQTALASENIANTVGEIAKGSSQQAKDTEESALSVEEMGNLIEEQSQEHIKDLNKALIEINHRKEEGFDIMKTY